MPLPTATVCLVLSGAIRAGYDYFQERKAEAIAIAARNLRTSNTDLIERQWQYAKSYMFREDSVSDGKGFQARIRGSLRTAKSPEGIWVAL